MTRRLSGWHRWSRTEDGYACACGLSVTKTEHDRGVRTQCPVDRDTKLASKPWESPQPNHTPDWGVIQGLREPIAQALETGFKPVPADDLLESAAAVLEAAGFNRQRFRVALRSRSEQILMILRKTPRHPIRLLAEEIYGSDRRVHCDRTRALLAQLGRFGRARNVGLGQWEAC